jgi:hypothetical protein
LLSSKKEEIHFNIKININKYCPIRQANIESIFLAWRKEFLSVKMIVIERYIGKGISFVVTEYAKSSADTTKQAEAQWDGTIATVKFGRHYGHDPYFFFFRNDLANGMDAAI